MKKLLFIVGIVASVVSCTSNSGANSEERRAEYAEYIDVITTIEFEEISYDFGTVVDGDMVKHQFKFTNSGEENLVLFNVSTSCGCTVPENWPKHPIAPGEGGEIEVIFNSHDKVGMVNKSIRIEANTNPTVNTVNIIGEVKAAE